jgi:hypothetical protein
MVPSITGTVHRRIPTHTVTRRRATCEAPSLAAERNRPAVRKTDRPRLLGQMRLLERQTPGDGNTDIGLI